jgi:hypothetical protein
LNTATEETNLRSETPRNTNTTSTPSQEEIAELTKLYFTQLTNGCPDGTSCPDPEYCGTCKENPNKAAITALKLIVFSLEDKALVKVGGRCDSNNGSGNCFSGNGSDKFFVIGGHLEREFG